jgi:hypothetical protein
MNINALKRKINLHRGFMGKPEGTIPLERHMRGWNYNIKTDLRVLRWEGWDWKQFAWVWVKWLEFVYTMMKLLVPQNVENFLTS